MTHSMVIHALTGSWYPRISSSNPTGDVLMDLDPWRSSCVVKMVEEAHEASCMVKKSLVMHVMVIGSSLKPLRLVTTLGHT